MPVRPLSSGLLRWPGLEEVEAALQEWAREIARSHPEVLRVGFFGSYARGDWGVGSDLDVVILVAEADAPFSQRAVKYPYERLPVPADVLVYTPEEWENLDTAFARQMRREVKWVYSRAGENAVPGISQKDDRAPSMQ